MIYEPNVFDGEFVKELEPTAYYVDNLKAQGLGVTRIGLDQRLAQDMREAGREIEVNEGNLMIGLLERQVKGDLNVLLIPLNSNDLPSTRARIYIPYGGGSAPTVAYMRMHSSPDIRAARDGAEHDLNTVFWSGILALSAMGDHKQLRQFDDAAEKRRRSILARLHGDSKLWTPDYALEQQEAQGHKMANDFPVLGWGFTVPTASI